MEVVHILVSPPTFSRIQPQLFVNVNEYLYFFLTLFYVRLSVVTITIVIGWSVSVAPHLLRLLNISSGKSFLERVHPGQAFYIYLDVVLKIVYVLTSQYSTVVVPILLDQKLSVYTLDCKQNSCFCPYFAHHFTNKVLIRKQSQPPMTKLYCSTQHVECVTHKVPDLFLSKAPGFGTESFV